MTSARAHPHPTSPRAQDLPPNLQHGGNVVSSAAGGSFAAGSLNTRAEDAMSVEEAVALLRGLRRSEPLPERVLRALGHWDSRAVALLLKDLSKAGHDARAVELFDWLRAVPTVVPELHSLRSLCDVYTYTAVISLCIYQQNVDRAMMLLEEMRQRGVERNVSARAAARGCRAPPPHSLTPQGASRALGRTCTRWCLPPPLPVGPQRRA
jgi:pentatricopeptide repeat protein